MVGYIYLITDTTNNMKYVGQHHYNKEGELDPSYHGSGIIISRIYKERPETLKEEYIKTCYSDNEMNDDEQYYIKFYNALWPNGYNLSEGGGGGIPCEEIRKKISKKLKGRPSPIKGKHHSEETKKKLSDAHKGKPAPNKGKPHSQETKKKISEILKEKFLHDENYRRKIKDACKGRPAHNKGKPMSEEQKKKLRNGTLSKHILQFTLDGEFVREWISLHECSRNGFDRSFVSACCRGKYKSAYGYIWKYKE